MEAAKPGVLISFQGLDEGFRTQLRTHPKALYFYAHSHSFQVSRRGHRTLLKLLAAAELRM